MCLCRLVVSTDPLEAKPGELMLCPEMVEFAPGALAELGGHYTGEIQFSGKSARMARRLSRRATGDQVSTTFPSLFSFPKLQSTFLNVMVELMLHQASGL